MNKGSCHRLCPLLTGKFVRGVLLMHDVQQDGQHVLIGCLAYIHIMTSLLVFLYES